MVNLVLLSALYRSGQFSAIDFTTIYLMQKAVPNTGIHWQPTISGVSLLPCVSFKSFVKDIYFYSIYRSFVCQIINQFPQCLAIDNSDLKISAFLPRTSKRHVINVCRLSFTF